MTVSSLPQLDNTHIWHCMLDELNLGTFPLRWSVWHYIVITKPGLAQAKSEMPDKGKVQFFAALVWVAVRTLHSGMKRTTCPQGMVLHTGFEVTQVCRDGQVFSQLICQEVEFIQLADHEEQPCQYSQRSRALCPLSASGQVAGQHGEEVNDSLNLHAFNLCAIDGVHLPADLKTL